MKITEKLYKSKHELFYVVSFCCRMLPRHKKWLHAHRDRFVETLAYVSVIVRWCRGDVHRDRLKSATRRSLCWRQKLTGRRRRRRRNFVARKKQILKWIEKTLEISSSPSSFVLRNWKATLFEYNSQFLTIRQFLEQIIAKLLIDPSPRTWQPFVVVAAADDVDSVMLLALLQPKFFEIAIKISLLKCQLFRNRIGKSLRSVYWTMPIIHVWRFAFVCLCVRTTDRLDRPAAAAVVVGAAETLLCTKQHLTGTC